MTTIDEIYAAINPLPAKLSAKGKVNPVVDFWLEANAGIRISMKWQKFGSERDWDCEYKSFSGESFEGALAGAVEFIDELPSAKQAKLHHFMGQLGRLIDAGKSEGIEVDYLNPLLDTMNRLSENIITYKPKRA
jgi:hypothetical protein